MFHRQSLHKIAAILVMLAAVTSARAAISLVATATCNAQGTITSQPIYANGGVGVNMTGATLFVGVCTTLPTCNFADSSGNTWLPLTAQTNSMLGEVQLFYVQNPIVSASQTFSVNAQYQGVCAMGFSGTAVAGGVDQQSGANAAATGSITPAVANEVLVSATIWSGTSTPTQPTSFTGLTYDQDAGTGTNIALSYRVYASTAAIDPTWTYSGSPAQFASVVGSWKPHLSNHLLTLLGAGPG